VGGGGRRSGARGCDRAPRPPPPGKAFTTPVHQQAYSEVRHDPLPLRRLQRL
jgi:hypothetical protein